MLLIKIAAGIFIVSWVLNVLMKIGDFLIDTPSSYRPPSPIWPPSAWYPYEKIILGCFLAAFLYLLSSATIEMLWH